MNEGMRISSGKVPTGLEGGSLSCDEAKQRVWKKFGEAMEKDSSDIVQGSYTADLD